MVPAKTPIHVALDRFGRDAGLELHRRAWFWHTDEVVVVCSLQKSQWSRAYYLNVGVYLRSLGDELHPAAEDCHLSLRGGDLLGHETDLSELLDLEKPIERGDRSLRLYMLLHESLEPAIKRADTVAGVRAMLADGSLPDYKLTIAARKALGLPALPPLAG